MVAWIPIGVVVLVLIWAMVMYNGLVRLRQQCREAWSIIDTELQRRYDLIPNLVETVKGYAVHERRVLNEVVDARTRAMASVGSPAAQAHDENTLIGSLQRLLVVVEGYPDLKASRNYLHLQQELAMTEDRIQAARRFYNGNVRDLNTRIEAVPSNLIAGLFSFRHRDYFTIDDVRVRVPPRVDLA